MMFTFDAFVQGTVAAKIPAKLKESLCSTDELFIGHLHNILVSLSMVLFTVTQGTLSSPGEPNYGFEDEVRIELGVPRILTT